MASGASAFRGLSACEQTTSVSIFEWGHCENRCQVSRVKVDGVRAHLGDACERFTAKDQGHSGEGGLSPLAAERDALLRSFVRAPQAARATLGLPWASFLHQQLPFWATLLPVSSSSTQRPCSSSSRSAEWATSSC